MKKIIFILFALLIFINVVKANTWQEDKIEGYNAETEYRYRFYKENKSGEYLDDDIENNYKYIDEDNFIYEENDEWSTECDNEEEIYESIIKYDYRELLPVMFIEVINTSDQELKLNSISVYNMETFVPSVLYVKYLYDSTNKILSEGGSIIMKFNEYIPLEKLILNIDFENADLEYQILLGYGRNLNKDGDYIVAETAANTNQVEYKYNPEYKLYQNYKEEILTGYNIGENEFIRIENATKLCKKKNKKYFYYNIEKEYYDDNYYVSIDEISELTEEEKIEYKKDENDYKIFYRYKETDNNIEESNNDLKEDDNDEINDVLIIETTKEKNTTTLSNNLKLVNTGITKKETDKNNYFIIIGSSLILIFILLIKRFKNNVD